MALIIEDATIVSGADSFATLAELRAYASARGVTLPADDVKLEALARKSTDYMKSLEPRFSGDRVSATQAMPFPRKNLDIYGFKVDPATIPPQVKEAQCAICMIYSTTDLMPVNTGKGQVIRQKTDVLETQWSESSYVGSPSSPLIDAALAPLFKSGGLTAITVRV